MAQFEDRCSDVGLLPSNFEDHLGNTTLSNGMMLEMKKSPLGTQVENKICKIHGCNAVSIRLQITKVRDKYSKLRKSASKPGGRETLEEYLDEPFHLPVQELRQTPTKPVCPNCEKLNQVLEDMGNKHQDKINTVTNVMARRNKNLKNRGKKVRSKLKRLEKVIGTARNPKDVCRQITRLKQSRQKWQERYNTLRRENNHMKLVQKQTVIRSSKYRRRIQKMKEAQKAQEKKQRSIKKHTVEQKHEYIMELENHIDKLEARVESLTSPVQTKVGRAYNAAVREVSYYLQVSFISSNEKKGFYLYSGTSL